MKGVPVEVVGPDMMCFMVDEGTLEPLGCSYYEPAAWADPKGPQMSVAEWSMKRAAQSAALHQSEEG